MAPGGKAKRVRIYTSEGDLVGRTPTYLAIVQFLQRENAAGATVLRAVEGFGGAGVLHTSHLVDVLQRLPLVVEWVDSVERVERLLPHIKEMVARGLITLEEIEVVQDAPHPVRAVSSHVSAGEVMSRDVVSVTPETPVRRVIELMLGKLYRAVPVLEDGVPVGIVTNSDLVERGGLGVRMELLPALAADNLQAELERLGAHARTARDVMTASPVTVRASTPLTLVADLMARRRLKRFPVVDDRERLVGMISRLDLLRTVAAHYEQGEAEPGAIGLAAGVPIARVMRRDVPTVHPETPVAEVLPAVFSTRLNRAVVVDHDRHVVGIVTDAELLERVTPSLKPGALRSLMQRLPFVHASAEHLATEQHARARTAQELMRAHVPIAREDTPLGRALAPMLRGKEKLIAVVDSAERLVGIVDRADILRGLVT
jgi:CBS domain-containing protein/PII-like signaling protein